MSPRIAQHIGPDRLPYVPVCSCYSGDSGEEIDERGEIKARMLVARWRLRGHTCDEGEWKFRCFLWWDGLSGYPLYSETPVVLELTAGLTLSQLKWRWKLQPKCKMLSTLIIFMHIRMQSSSKHSTALASTVQCSCDSKQVQKQAYKSTVMYLRVCVLSV